jgi:membrane protease YdiL (CAAX protease family)
VVRNGDTGVPVWTPADAGRSLWRAGVSVHLGVDRAKAYNGYLLPRFQVLSRSTGLAIAIVAFVWSLQHAFMPLTLDARFMAFRLLSPIPQSVFVTLLYLRLRRVLPLAIAHALMDGASVLIVLLSAMRA